MSFDKLRTNGVFVAKSLLVPLVTLLIASAPVLAAEADRPPAPRPALTVYGNDACPKGKNGDIVVCAREPESERYRIPKRFRQRPREDSGPGASWASRVEGLEDAQRFTRPNGCSPVGSNGQSGCTQAALRQWFLERRLAKAQDKEIP